MNPEECKAYMKAYNQTPEHKAARKKWTASEKGKASIAKYNQSEKARAARKRYEDSEKGRAAQAKYMATYLQRPGARKKMAEANKRWYEKNKDEIRRKARVEYHLKRAAWKNLSEKEKLRIMDEMAVALLHEGEEDE